MKTPEDLLHFPEGSVLEDVVDYTNRTAIYSQPQFAVATAIILGAMVLGRNYRTDQKNYTNLNFVLIADTSAGKEHGITVLEALNQKAGLDLIGPSNYTSQGGVYSALLRRPSHLTIIDEWGRVLKAIKHSQNSNSDTAMTTLMQLFGRADGVYRHMGYSELNKRKNKNAEDEAELPTIIHPCVSILAVTAPGTFWDTVNGDNVEDGFLPRFLIIESEMPLTEKRDIEKAEPSKRLISWMINHAFPITDPIYAEDKTHNIYKEPGISPEPNIISFSEEATILRKEYDRKILRRRNNEKDSILRCMWGKTEEIARRVSLVVAISRDHDTITGEDYTWAQNFVDYYTILAIKEAKIKVCDSVALAIANDIWRLIEESGEKGITERELVRHSRKYGSLQLKQRKVIMEMVDADHDVKFIVNHQGSNRNVWILKNELITLTSGNNLVQTKCVDTC